LITSIILSLILIASGYASQYAPGVMQRVIRVRQNNLTAYSLPLTLPSVDGYVAAQDCSTIGSIVYLRQNAHSEWERFLVADCASRTSGSPRDGESSYTWMQRNNILFEIDHETALRWNTVGRLSTVQQALHNPERIYR